MAEQSPKGSQVRSCRRFRPGAWDNTPELEARVLLSHIVATPRRVAILGQSGRAANAIHAAAHSRRITPAAEINAAYNAFLADFANVENAYVQAINEQASGTVAVSANLIQPYAAGASTMVVDNATVFGPSGTFSTPVIATATIAGIPNGSQYVFTGRSGSNTLIVNVSQSSQVALAPPGVALTASVPASSQTSAAGIFPSFIINRTNEMAIGLVQYFNGLPLKLPKFNNPPHTPINRAQFKATFTTRWQGETPRA